jgi:hypothetical protein
MRSRVAMKIGLITVLLAAPIVFGSPRDGFTLLFVAFGIANVLLEPAGTRVVRVIAVAAAFAGLFFGNDLRMLVVLLAWLVWPAAFMVAWGLARNTSETWSTDPPDGNAVATRARATLAALIAAVAAAVVAYRVIAGQGLQQTAALFVGIPAFLAMVVVFVASPRTATGVACKAVTVGLLVSLLFLGEGLLCVVMAAPLFYAVAVGIAAFMDVSRWRQYRPPTMTGLIVLITVPMSLEGVTTFTTLNRNESVTAAKTVHATPQQIERALFEPPRFERALPLYLRAGFPSAIATRIERNADGMRWVIRLRGGEMRITGMEPRSGELTLALEESRPGLVRWRAVSDTSHMTHFLKWRAVSVQWSSVDAETSKVTWTVGYERGLDPAWYFGPWERYAAQLAADYLIDTVATP